MASITSQPAPRRRSFGDFLRAAAEGFFQLCAKAAEAYDSLPLENKHRIKRLLAMSLPKPRPDFETQALFGDELELAKLLSEHGWWVLERDITGPVLREILRLGREGKEGAIDRYLCALFSQENHARLEGKVAAWFELPYLSERQEIILQ